MQPLLDIIERAAYQYMVGTHTARAYSLGPAIALGVLFLAGCVFLAFALYFWLATIMAPAGAALFTGLSLVLTALVFFWYQDVKARRDIAALERRHQELMAMTQALIDDSAQITREIEGFACESPKESLLLASLAGFFFSDLVRR